MLFIGVGISLLFFGCCFFKLNCAIVIPLMMLYALTMIVAFNSNSFLIGIIVGFTFVGTFAFIIYHSYEKIDACWGSIIIFAVVFLLIFLSLAQVNWYCTGWSLKVSLFIFLICLTGFITGGSIGYCVEKPKIDKSFNKEGAKEPSQAQMESIWNGRHWTTAALGAYLVIRGGCFLMFDEYYP